MGSVFTEPILILARFYLPAGQGLMVNDLSYTALTCLSRETAMFEKKMSLATHDLTLEGVPRIKSKVVQNY